MSIVGKRHGVRLRNSAGLSGAMHGLLTARNAVLEAIAAIDGVDPDGERFNELQPWYAQRLAPED
jgi:hypothetical protein